MKPPPRAAVHLNRRDELEAWPRSRVACRGRDGRQKLGEEARGRAWKKKGVEEGNEFFLFFFYGEKKLASIILFFTSGPSQHDALALDSQIDGLTSNARPQGLAQAARTQRCGAERGGWDVGSIRAAGAYLRRFHRVHRWLIVDGGRGGSAAAAGPL